MGITKNCKPRSEVLKGDLDDAIFAANFGDLIENKAPAVRRRTADTAIVHRRSLNGCGQERLTRIGAIGPLAFSARAGLLRTTVRATSGHGAKLSEGPFHPLDPNWDARVACYALLARGLRNAQRPHKSAEHMRNADCTEAAWWFGLMSQSAGKRAIRALRILTEAVR